MAATSRFFALATICVCTALASPTRADPRAELAPLVADEPQRALELLEKLPSTERGMPDMQYLRARLLERLDRDAEALAHLPAPNAGLPEVVAQDVAQRRALLSARLGDCGPARLLANAEAPRAVRIAAAECALAAKNPADALAHVEALGRRADTIGLRLRLADVLSAAGKRTEAVDTLLGIYASHPTHRRIEDVETRLKLLGAKPTFEHVLARAEELADRGRAHDALAALSSLRPPRSRAENAWLTWTRGWALFKTRRHYPEASRTLARAARLGGDKQQSAAFLSARALSRAGHNRSAVHAYRAFARRYRGSDKAKEATYLAAWLELRDGRATAMQRLVQGNAKHMRPGDRASGAFDLGLWALERGRTTQARKWFATYAESVHGHFDRARGHYWTGRTSMDGARGEAIAAFERAIQADPLGWYALLAAQRLDELNAARPPPIAPAERSIPRGGTPIPVEVEFYTRLGLHDDARAVLRDAEPALRAKGVDGIAALVEHYQAIGDHARAYQVVLRDHAELLYEAPGPGQAWAWRAALARPHQPRVRSAAAERKLDEALVYAVMRKESAFKPDVVSWADAVGLMQLLPKTASGVAKRLGDAYSREQLFEPAHNIRWGTRLLAELRDEFDGNVVLMLGAYNAGSHRVRAWLEREARRKPAALDLFVERIPIEQTRNYVRRVVSGWSRYRYFAAPDAGWPVVLPEVVGPVARASARPR